MKKLIANMLGASVALACTNTPTSAQPFRAEQYVQSASIEIHGNIAQVFPLFTPLGEKLWSQGWDPKIIAPPAGEMQEGLIFQTPDHAPGAPALTWVVSSYSVSTHQIRYVLTSPVRVGIISVTCIANGENRTEATISHTLTGLSPEGNELSRHILGRIFTSNLKDWETAINEHLK